MGCSESKSATITPSKKPTPSQDTKSRTIESSTHKFESDNRRKFFFEAETILKNAKLSMSDTSKLQQITNYNHENKLTADIANFYYIDSSHSKKK